MHSSSWTAKSKGNHEGNRHMTQEGGHMTHEPWNVSSPRELKQLLGAHGFSFKKQLGQNFLIEPRVLEQIVQAAEVTPNDGVFEIGPGAGVVTQLLAQSAGKVVAVEKDQSLRPVLQESLSGFDNVELVFDDVLKLDLVDVWKGFEACAQVSVVGNLPYYVTTPIVFHIFSFGLRVSNVVLMVQKEVADRLAANPGGKDYGALSVAVQYRAVVEKVAKVSPGAFYPSPAVDSTVVRLRIRKSPAVSVVDEAVFFRVVRAAFATRRKTLLNSLSGGLGVSKDESRTLLEQAGIDSRRRGETLSLEEFATLANVAARSRE